MALHSLIRRASSLLASSSTNNSKHSYADGEIVFSKNNVCVHTPSQCRRESSSVHHPGYLVVRCRHVKKHSINDESSNNCSDVEHLEIENVPDNPSTFSTLTLTWIPNEKLARNHELVSQLNPELCGTGGLSRSCSPCRFSDTDSISISSFCCGTDTACTASIASRSYEESSTAPITSDVSSSEAPTLSVQQLEAIKINGHTEEFVAAELPQDSPSTVGAINLTTESFEIGTDAVLSTECNGTSCCNDSPNSAETGELFEKDSGALSPSSSSCLDLKGSCKQTEEDETGVFFESSSSGGLSQNELKEICNIFNSACGETNNIDNELSILQKGTEIDNNLPNIIETTASINCEVTVDGTNVSKHEECESKSSAANASGFKPKVHKHYAESCCERGDNASIDSSPEPHIPAYGGIYNGDASDGMWYEGSAESMAFSANLAFPEWSGSIASSWSSSYSILPSAAGSCCESPAAHAQKHSRLAIFNVDLGEMRSLRLFFSDVTGCRGQLVIASRESQYKILHFHHSGLDKLAAVFEDWNFLVPPRDNSLLLERLRRERQRRPSLTAAVDGDCSEQEEQQDEQGVFKQFSVCRPMVTPGELHPAEGTVPELDAEDWLTFFSKEGRIEDDLSLRRRIFFGGLEPQLRSSVWPFLLRCYPYTSTFAERQLLADQNKLLYQRLTEHRERMVGEEREEFWRNVQCTVEKDVVRTDRSNPCFAGHDNPNLTKMKDILLNFALHRPDIGYTQGMSDILAPILSEVRHEPDVFWCFTGLMSKTIFVTSPRDSDMERNLRYLRELLRIMAPAFHEHIMLQRDGHFLLFCHRWILLCFKREFEERSVLSLWEACWSNYQTDYFHLFVAVAIVCVYGTEVTQQNLRPDETLLYFTSLAHHMDADLVIKKARGLLHKFRGLPQLPCTLVGLCELCGPGMWDSGHNPTVVCSGEHIDELCPADSRLSC